MRSLEQADLDRFRQLVGNRLGLQFDKGKNDVLAGVLLERPKHLGYASPAPYLAAIARGAREEWRTLASELTVPETYFFRGFDQFRALTETVIPERIQARERQRRLRFLSAGCASGEEPYSVAILLQERFPDLAGWEIEIVGMDVNPAMIAKATQGRFPRWSLRETPADLREKYFQAEGDVLVLRNIRSQVTFHEENLVTVDLARFGDFDVVLCRNTIMYLLAEVAQSVIAKLTQALVPLGFLFLGYAETLRGISHDFHLRHTQDVFYYQKRGDQESSPSRSDFPLTVAPSIEAGGWMESVQRASERIQDLFRASVPVVESVPGIAADKNRSSAPGLGLALELLRQERFGEAMEVMRTLPAEASHDPDVQLLQAVLLVNCGDLEAAERVCSQILSSDDLNAGAHYLAALCRERFGDSRGATEHDRAAIYLDGTFAMPHLHLGRMAKQARDLITARQELESACALLSREDPSRLLLFGGGFSRDALVSFSKAELRSCGSST